MSDSEDSTVTYTAVSSPFADLPDIGSPGVDGPPVMPEDPYAYVVAAFQAPPSPDYVSGPEYPPSPDFVPEPVYPEFMPPEDEVLPAEEQPLPAAASPTADSPCYVPELDPEEDPEELMCDVDIEGGDDEEEEEEHLASADSTAVALPAVINTQLPSDFSPPLPVSSPVPVLSPSPPASPIRPLGYRVAMIRLRTEAASTSHSLPLPPPIILSHTRSDAPSSGTLPLLPIPLSIALGLRYEVGESSSAAARPPGGFRADYGFVATIDREIIRDLEIDVDYGITDTWDEMPVDMLVAPTTDDT
ncbi:hypothetical protein Tco_1354916 [Tanacetum coccineum]